MTARELYNHAIKPLPTRERLRLAAIILNDLTDEAVDFSEEWTEQDLEDFKNWSWSRLGAELVDEENA